MIGGVIAGALTLIALQVFGSADGPQRGGALLGWVAGGVAQFISPDKAAIPNVAHPATPKPPAVDPNAGGGSGSPGPGGSPGAGVPVSLPRNPTVI